MARHGQIHVYGGGAGLGNIVDEEHYKLDVRVTELRNENFQLSIERWIPETGWTKLELFLTDAELKRIQKALSI
jgi:hypothetical protein